MAVFWAAACIVIGAAAFLFGQMADAQKSVSARWEYAVITGAYFPYTSENASAITVGAVNICYVSTAGCRNEEVRVDVGIQRFIQDSRLADGQSARKLARNRAAEIAFAKAMSQLGAGGWEMTSAPDLRLDKFVVNEDGFFNVIEGNYESAGTIYFKRAR